MNTQELCHPLFIEKTPAKYSFLLHGRAMSTVQCYFLSAPQYGQVDLKSSNEDGLPKCIDRD
jgi:hypothetical protein